MRFIILTFSLFSLSGCMGNLQQLELSSPEANDFDSALAAEYLAYATSESEQGREDAADYFAAKGLKALAKEAVLPEPVDATLPKSLQKRQASTRKQLISLLTDDVKHVVPQPAARAQLLFDCWVKASARSDKEANICADELPPTLDTLQSVATSLSKGVEQSHAFHFASGSNTLSEAAQQEVLLIAGALKDRADYAVEIEGTYGTSAGRKLFLSRADAISRALVAQGVREDDIEIKQAKRLKAVRLSSDKKVRDSSRVTVMVRIFGIQTPGQEGKVTP